MGHTPISVFPFPGTFTWWVFIISGYKLLSRRCYFFYHSCSWFGKERERKNWNRTTEKTEEGTWVHGIATVGIMTAKRRELDFMECCCAIARKHMGCFSYSYRNKLWSEKLSWGQGEWEDWKSWLSSRRKWSKCSQNWQWLGLFIKELGALISEYKNILHFEAR